MPPSKKMAALLFMRRRLIGVGFEGQGILYLNKYKSQQNFWRTKKIALRSPDYTDFKTMITQINSVSLFLHN
jgi:hypothetical protein